MEADDLRTVFQPKSLAPAFFNIALKIGYDIAQEFSNALLGKSATILSYKNYGLLTTACI